MQTFTATSATRLRRSLCLLSLVAIVIGCSTHTSQNNGMQQDATAAFHGEWELLFDGKTTAGWRGINRETFPEQGWKAEDGMLVVDATDGKESGAGGDIITAEQYGNFILEWEWKMLTKGGNSGVKYFVKEGNSGNEIRTWAGVSDSG